MSLVFVVVSEAPADFTTATELADRVLCEQIDWLDESLLDSQRTWIATTPQGESLQWKTIAKLARESVPVRGHFSDGPALIDAKAARRALNYIRDRFDQVDAVILVRDLDDQSERRDGLIQARNDSHSPTAIVIGTANIERESWVLSGFVPTTPEEQLRLETERQELGFDPCRQPQELKAGKNDQAKRSPKRVLSVLTGGNRERETACWLTTDLSVLRDQGAANGLLHYLEEVEQRLVPLVSGQSPRKS